MSADESVLQSMRTFLKTAATFPAGPVLTDEQVIVGDAKGPRPALPYMTVKLTIGDQHVGVDELIAGTSGGLPAYVIRGVRTASVSVQAFDAPGASVASTWLRTAGGVLQLPTIAALLQTEGISVESVGPLTDLSAFFDTEIESRSLREWNLIYGFDSGIDTAVEALTLEIDTTLEQFDGDPDPLTDTTTITL